LTSNNLSDSEDDPLTPTTASSDYQNNVPLIDALNSVRSRGVFLSNKIIRTAVFTGKQPQAFWRGTRQRPIRLRGTLSQATQQWCHRGAVSKPLAVCKILLNKKIFLDRTGPTSDQSEHYFGNHYRSFR
jgi:hypothetical protein